MDTFREIQLTQGKVAIVDAADFEQLNRHKWYAHYAKCADTWYARRNVPGRPRSSEYMHNRILETNLQVDHIDTDGLHNWRSNLRPATRSQNLRNQSKRRGCRSRYKGVTWNEKKQRWIARIQLDAGRKYLGSFPAEVDAARAYNKAALEFFGAFARINQIN